MPQYYLMKAEPDSRMEKGKDVKFSIDDLRAQGSSQWDGVRNHQAKNSMRKMRLGDQILFYHSNCKVPGVYGLAEVSRESYPDWSAWDPAHPYYDPKTKQDDPTWFMVDVTYKAHLAHPPTLLLLKTLAAAPTLPAAAAYIGEAGHRAIQGMALIKSGRLSVQPVEAEAYTAVLRLGERGGWEALVEKPSAGRGKGKAGAGKADAGGETNNTAGARDVSQPKAESKSKPRRPSSKRKDAPDDVASPPTSKCASGRARRSKVEDGGVHGAASDSSLSPAPEPAVECAPAAAAAVDGAVRRSSRRRAGAI